MLSLVRKLQDQALKPSPKITVAQAEKRTACRPHPHRGLRSILVKGATWSTARAWILFSSGDRDLCLSPNIAQTGCRAASPRPDA
jgi:hypothetical protein